jgi:hypothetical protein
MVRLDWNDAGRHEVNGLLRARATDHYKVWLPSARTAHGFLRFLERCCIYPDMNERFHQLDKDRDALKQRP